MRSRTCVCVSGNIRSRAEGANARRRATRRATSLCSAVTGAPEWELHPRSSANSFAASNSGLSSNASKPRSLLSFGRAIGNTSSGGSTRRSTQRGWHGATNATSVPMSKALGVSGASTIVPTPHGEELLVATLLCETGANLSDDRDDADLTPVAPQKPGTSGSDEVEVPQLLDDPPGANRDPILAARPVKSRNPSCQLSPRSTLIRASDGPTARSRHKFEESSSVKDRILRAGSTLGALRSVFGSKLVPRVRVSPSGRLTDARYGRGAEPVLNLTVRALVGGSSLIVLTALAGYMSSWNRGSCWSLSRPHSSRSVRAT